MKLALKDTDKIRFTENRFKGIHLHEMLLDGVWTPVPGATTISGLFPSDAWKFAWPPKLMAEKLVCILNDGKVICEADIKTAKNAWREKRDKAADSGSRSHEIIESYIKTNSFDTSSENIEVQNSVHEFMLWEAKTRPQWLASELQVGSLSNRFCGILDAVAIIDGKTALVDFKTSASGDKPEYAIQLAGLHIALTEMGIIPEKRVVLHLPKKGQYSYIPIETDLDKDKQAFLAALEFYKHKNIFLARCK